MRLLTQSRTAATRSDLMPPAVARRSVATYLTATPTQVVQWNQMALTKFGSWKKYIRVQQTALLSWLLQYIQVQQTKLRTLSCFAILTPKSYSGPTDKAADPETALLSWPLQHIQVQQTKLWILKQLCYPDPYNIFRSSRQSCGPWSSWLTATQPRSSWPSELAASVSTSRVTTANHLCE